MKNICFLAKLLFISFTIALYPHYSFCKETNAGKIDSLKNELKKAGADTARLNLLEALYLNTVCNDTTSSLSYIKEYMAIAKKTNNLKSIEKAEWWMGLYNFECIRNYKTAIDWYTTAADHARILGDRKEEALLLTQIAQSYQSSLEYGKAIEYYRMSMERDPDKQKVTGILGNMGTAYTNMGDYANAADCFERAYNIQNEMLATSKKNNINDSLNLIGLLISLADVDISMSQYDKALGYYQRSKELNSSIRNRAIDLWCVLGTGKCFQLKKDYAAAIRDYEAALPISRELHDYESESELLTRIGNIYLATGDLGKAMDHAMDALKISEGKANSVSLPGTYLLLGNIFSAKKALPKAVSFLQKAIALYNKSGQMDDESTAWMALSSAYEQMGRTSEAFSAYKHHIALHDSVFSLENAKKITRIEMRGEFDRKEVSDSLKQARKDAAVKLHIQRQSWLIYGGFIALLLVLLVSFFVYRGYSNEKRANAAINAEKQVSEALLLNILPAGVAQELKEKGKVKAKLFDNVTVLMTDFVDFTLAGERLSPEMLVDELHNCFEAFDNIISKYKIEKIKTVGDAYVAVSGLPDANPNHASDIVRAAIEIRDFIEQRKKERGGDSFGIRMGINSGKLVAGIVGVTKFAYDIWGDTVNTAARMEQNGEEGKINISHATFELVKDEFECTYRGEIDAKNKGNLKMYFVETPTPNP